MRISHELGDYQDTKFKHLVVELPPDETERLFQRRLKMFATIIGENDEGLIAATLYGFIFGIDPIKPNIVNYHFEEPKAVQ